MTLVNVKFISPTGIRGLTVTASQYVYVPFQETLTPGITTGSGEGGTLLGFISLLMLVVSITHSVFYVWERRRPLAPVPMLSIQTKYCVQCGKGIPLDSSLLYKLWFGGTTYLKQ